MRNFLSTSLALSTVFFVGTALAQADASTAVWPTKPVKIIVPWAPGGAVDVVTRKMAQKLSEQTGQNFYVENRAGATGTIGAQLAARADDGHTLLANDMTYSLLPHIFKKLPFDYDKDLQPVGAYVLAPMALAVNAQGNYKTLKDLVADAKSKANKVTYGSGGAGTTPHFASEAFGIAAGANLLHVPFKGAGEAAAAVLAGNVDVLIASTPGLMANVKGGRLRLLAVSGHTRLGPLPDVPTFAEAGVNWRGVQNWTGLWAPKGFSPAASARLQKEIALAMNSADMKTFSDNMGAEPRYVDSEAFGKILRDNTDAWSKVVANSAFEKF